MITTGGTNLFIAAQWRSGSTHISRSMGALLRFRPASTAGFHGEGSEQQNINIHSAGILFPYGSQVFQQHVWASTQNTNVLKAYRIRPVVLTRDPLDILVSLRTHINSLAIPVIPGLEIPKRFHALSEFDQYQWLVYHAIPWLLQFERSWKTADIQTLHITYKEFFTDQIAGCKKIAEWLKLPLPEDPVIEALCGLKHNFVTGRIGEGARSVPETLRGLVYDMIDMESKAWEDK